MGVYLLTGPGAMVVLWGVLLLPGLLLPAPHLLPQRQGTPGNLTEPTLTVPLNRPLRLMAADGGGGAWWEESATAVLGSAFPLAAWRYRPPLPQEMRS